MCRQKLLQKLLQILATKVKVQYLGNVQIWRNHCYQTIKKVFHFLYDIIINIRLYNDFHYFLTFLMGKIELLPLLLASTISDDKKTYLTNLNIWMCYKTFLVHFQTLVVFFFLFPIKLSLKWGVTWYSFMKLDFHLLKGSKKVAYQLLGWGNVP